MKRLVSMLLLGLSLLLPKVGMAGDLKVINASKDNTFYMRDIVDDYMAEKLVAFLAKANASAHEKEIVVVIDSPGGSVLSGATIVDAIKHSRTPVKCVVNSLAASMAAITLQYCAERYATENSLIMYHDASGGFFGSFQQIESRFAALNRYVKLFDKVVAQRIGISEVELQERSKTEWWLAGAEEAKKANVVDAIVRLNTVSVEEPSRLFDLFGARYRYGYRLLTDHNTTAEALQQTVGTSSETTKGDRNKQDKDIRTGVFGADQSLIDMLNDFQLK